MRSIEARHVACCIVLLVAGHVHAQEEYGYTAADANFLGRLTYLFSVGAELANDEDSFSKVSPHIRLDLDTTFRNRSGTVDAGYVEALAESIELGFAIRPQECKTLNPILRGKACTVELHKKQLKDIDARFKVPAFASCALSESVAGVEAALASDGDSEITRLQKLALTGLALGERPTTSGDEQTAWDERSGRTIRNKLHSTLADDGMNELVIRLVTSGQLKCESRFDEVSPEVAMQLGVPKPSLDGITDQEEQARRAAWTNDALDAMRVRAIRELGAAYFDRFTSRQRLDLRNLHTRVAFEFATIPTDDTAAATANDYIEAKKALTVQLAADYLVGRLEAFGGSLRLGPSVQVGLQTVAAEPGLDTVNSYWGIGLRMVEGHTESFGTMNPSVNRYVAFYWGDYEALDNKKFTFDARLQPNGGGPFVGFRAIVGEGPDDVRVTAGLAMQLDTVARFLRSALNLESILSNSEAGADSEP